MLDWSRAQWRKLHVGDHPEWIALSWQARTVFLHLFRAVDSTGKMDMGRAGPKAVAGLLRLPPEVFDVGFGELKTTGWLEQSGTWIFLPWFEESQNTPTAGVIRTQMWREKKRDATSQNVTDGDAARRGVTNVTKEEKREEEKREEEKKEEPEAARPLASRPSNFKLAWNEAASKSAGKIPRIPEGSDVTARESIRFNKQIWPQYPQTSPAWSALGAWFAAGKHNYGNALTTADILARGTAMLLAALSWEAERHAPASSPPPGFETEGQRYDRIMAERAPQLAREKAAREARAALTQSNGHKNGVVPHA